MKCIVSYVGGRRLTRKLSSCVAGQFRSLVMSGSSQLQRGSETVFFNLPFPLNLSYYLISQSLDVS
jgi:hypothetical protein